MSIFDSIGTALEGGLFARAVEPKHGSTDAGPDGHTHEGNCLNCGTALVGPHCHACGQKSHVHKTIGAFMHDLLHGALHFEGKTWHTIPLLAFRPGQLTRRYIDGERARFVSPMALFLFSVFLMFAVFQLAGFTPPTDFGSAPQIGSEANSEEAQQDQLEVLREIRAGMGDDNPGAAAIDAQIADLESKLEIATEEAAATADSGDSAPDASHTEDVLAAQNAAASLRMTTIETGVGFLDRGIKKWQENPSLMAYKLQSNSYKFSWLLIPLSLPFMWLLFAWRRKFGLYDHAVFVTYSLSFMTLLYVVLVLFGALGVSGGTLTIFGTTIPLIHIYKQLKGTYGLSRFSASWRTVMLSFFIFIILFLFIDLLLLMGGLG